jgi:hypothetical protein
MIKRVHGASGCPLRKKAVLYFKENEIKLFSRAMEKIKQVYPFLHNGVPNLKVWNGVRESISGCLPAIAGNLQFFKLIYLIHCMHQLVMHVFIRGSVRVSCSGQI